MIIAGIDFSMIRRDINMRFGGKCMYALRVILCLLGFGIIVRKLQRLYYIIKWKTQKFRRHDYERGGIRAEVNLSFLAFLCAFTENYPQSLLQMYIFVRNPVPIHERIGRSLITSALNLPVAYVNLYRVLFKYRDEGTDSDTVVFLFFYLGSLGAVVVRVLSIGLFMGTVSVKWSIIVLAVHFIGQFIFYHFYKKPCDCLKEKCSEYFKISNMAWLYSLVNIFIYFDQDVYTRKKWMIIANFVLLFVENITFVILSFTLVFNEYAMIYGMIIGVGCVVHVIMLSNYCMFLHPTVGDCFNCVDISDSEV